MSLRGKRVVIMTPSWAHGDGVGHDVEGMAFALSGAGCAVTVFAPDYYAPAYESWRVHVDTVRALLQDPATILVYHHSIGCEEIEELLRSAKCNIKILRYHNVTPPEFFVGYNDDWVRTCTRGRSITAQLVEDCNEFSVPSLYDARDLVHAGALVDRISYTPYFHKLADFDSVQPGIAVAQQLDMDTRFKVLFLGRRVNNKGHLHLVRTIAAYTRHYDSNIVLHLVGAADPGLKRYDDEIQSEIIRLGIQGNVIFHDKVPFADITAFYRGCDAFLCMSEHEGFCIPIIEAEYCGLPVLAHYRRGVPEALGPTQPWLTSLDYDEYARILRQMRVEPGYARSLSEAGAASVRQRFDIEAIRVRFLEWMEELVSVRNAPVVSQDLSRNALSRRKKIAFIVQRYGTDISGGAETFARMYGELLAEFYDITVLTTTSKTLDWDNDLVADTCAPTQDGIEILRFRPHYARDQQRLDEVTKRAMVGEISYEEWQRHHGPHVPEIFQYLDSFADEFDLIVNWTYIFSTATYAPRLSNRKKLVNIPFFHDEIYLYMPGCGENALQYDSNIYQTEAEKNLAEREIEGIRAKNSIVLGAGIDESVLDAVRSRTTVPPLEAPYIVYVGRIEAAKGVIELVENFRRFKASSSSKMKLVIIGRARDCAISPDEDIILPGFVSEEVKATYIKHAVCLVNPSHFESFSLVLIEAWSLGRPVLVTGNCAATKGQVERSGGGLVYDNYRDFAWALNTWEADSELGDRLGSNGQKFYEENYRWSTLLPKMRAFLDDIMSR